MKILLYMCFLSFVLIGCDSIIDSSNSISANGIINKIEISAWQYGTHTLQDEKGRPAYALKSASIDLDQFQNKMVSLSGKKIDGYPVDGGPIYLEVEYVQVIK